MRRHTAFFLRLYLEGVPVADAYRRSMVGAESKSRERCRTLAEKLVMRPDVQAEIERIRRLADAELAKRIADKRQRLLLKASKARTHAERLAHLEAEARLRPRHAQAKPIDDAPTLYGD